MEKRTRVRRNPMIGAVLSLAAITGCTIDSYHTDPSNVQCDGKRTKVDLAAEGMATFIVHGEQEDSVATVKVRRNPYGASVQVTGDVSGPPQQLEEDGYTAPVPVIDGSEISTFGAGGAWVIDVREDSVVIQGTCEGM